MGLSGLGLIDRHRIDRWRDDWTGQAALRLNNIAEQLNEWSDAEVKRAPFRDVVARPGAVVAQRIAPVVRSRAEPAVALLIQEANAALGAMVADRAIRERPAAGGSATSGPWEGHRDVALALAPLAGGVAVAAALPAVAFTTTSVFFGLFATTAISWPIAVAGGTVAGVAVVTGLVNTATMRGRFEARLARKARAHIAATLIRGTPEQPSVLEQMAAALARAADEAKGR